MAILETRMEQIGPYHVVRTLETAVSSEVLLAVTETFGVARRVVLKRMLPSVRPDAASMRRLTREAAAYSQLAHPSIVRMYDLLEYEGRPVLVLEYVDGPSLEQLLISYAVRKQKLTRGAAFHVASGIFAGLAAAHAARDPGTQEPTPIIHRDLSPGNVLFTREGEVKLADFGFARIVGRSPKDTARATKGSMGYMAPEQVLQQEPTPRTDVYGGALLLREMLTGEPAFPAGRTMSHGDRALMMADPHLAPIDEVCPDLPADLAMTLTIALKPNMEQRTIEAERVHLLLQAYAERANGRHDLRRALAPFVHSEA
jgi:eukaryotic-like serine/threonine-protein kinase